MIVVDEDFFCGSQTEVVCLTGTEQGGEGTQSGVAWPGQTTPGQYDPGLRLRVPQGHVNAATQGKLRFSQFTINSNNGPF